MILGGNLIYIIQHQLAFMCMQQSNEVKFCIVYCAMFLVAYQEYRYSVFAASSVGESPPLSGTFITREDSE